MVEAYPLSFRNFKSGFVRSYRFCASRGVINEWWSSSCSIGSSRKYLLSADEQSLQMKPVAFWFFALEQIMHRRLRSAYFTTYSCRYAPTASKRGEFCARDESATKLCPDRAYRWKLMQYRFPNALWWVDNVVERIANATQNSKLTPVEKPEG